MAEIRETHVVRRRGRGGWFVLTFLVGASLVGASLIAVVVVVLLNVQGTLSWPAGRIDFTLRPTASQPANPSVTATAENASPTALQSSTPAAAVPETTTAPAEAAPPATGEQPSTVEPTETTTPQ